MGELAVEDKHNEIVAIPKLLELIDIAGDIVTIDAIGCQTAIASKIREKEADYVLTLKDNQETLREDVKAYFDWLEREQPKSEFCDVWKSNPKKCHGRIETREILTASAHWLEGREQWKDIQTLIQCCCTREINGIKILSVRYYISSFETSAQALGEIIRGHWSVENQLHWILDVVFREDNAKARKDNSPLNLNILRKIALAVVKKIPVKRLNFHKKNDEGRP